MATQNDIDCSPLSTRTSFANYIQAINTSTSGDLSLVSRCKTEVCSALWGSGNPDISGIGMTVGYCLENILAFIFILAALYCQRSGGSRFARAMAKTLVSFYTSAVFFTFSLQIAAIVVLVRVNYGFNANDMGALTMEITWSISLISLLPILYGVLYPELFSIRNSDTLIPSASGQAHTKIQTQPSTELDTNRQEKTLKSLRLWLYLMCWVLSVYPFLSTMLVTFGPSQIGSGPGAVIPKSDFSIIENICWAEISRHSMAEEKAMSCFRVGTFLLIAVITMGKIIILAIEKHFSDSYPTLQESFQRIAEVGRIRETLLFLLPLLFVAQFWTYLRLQTEQLEMSRATGNLDGDLDWSFGQVVALTVFIPVAVDVLFWLRRNCKVKGVLSYGIEIPEYDFDFA